VTTVSKSTVRLWKALAGVEGAADLPRLIPGTALAVLVMLASLPLAEHAGRALLAAQGIDPAGRASPVSGVLVAIVVGMLLRNLLPLPAALRPGIQFATTKLLRLGIILVGIKLSLVDVLRLGAWGIPVVAGAIAAGLVFVTWFNRALRLPERLGTLIAAGTGICGVTAIVSVAPAIEAEEREVAYAVANITLFGLAAMFLYPYLAAEWLATPAQVGLFLGTSIHETAQVVGAALTYREVFASDAAFQAATVTKLTRNLFLAVVVPVLALVYHRRRARDAGLPAAAHVVNITRLLPVFVLGFVAMALLRSLGDATLPRALGLLDVAAWKSLTAQLGDVWGSRYLLGTAMAGVGLGTSFSVFRGVGAKPFAVGFAGALVVGGVGFVLAMLLGPYVKL
jgi:uncharacterized integral membrane protein (TIGR00698 family)